MYREQLQRWIESYERAWRTPGADALADLFTPDATYSMGPFEETQRGLEAIAVLWERERAGPDEVFRMESEIVAVERRGGGARRGPLWRSGRAPLPRPLDSADRRGGPLHGVRGMAFLARARPICAGRLISGGHVARLAHDRPDYRPATQCRLAQSLPSVSILRRSQHKTWR